MRATWDDTIEAFKAHLIKDKLSEITVSAYLADILTIKELVDLPPRQVTEKKLDSALAKIAKKHPSRAARVQVAAKRFYEFLIGQGILKNQPVVKTPRLKSPTERVKEISGELVTKEELALLKKISNSGLEFRDKLIVYLMYHCGLTTSEVAGIEIGDVANKPGLIRIRSKKDTRFTPIPEEVQAMIMRYLSERAEISKDTGSTKLFWGGSNASESELSRVTIYYAVKRVFNKAGVKRSINPEMLRMSHFYNKLGKTSHEDLLKEHGISNSTYRYYTAGLKK